MLVDEAVVRKDAAVEAQQGLDDLLLGGGQVVDVVELLALHHKHHARLHVLLLVVEDVTGAREEMERALDDVGEKVLLGAEAVEVEIVGHIVSVAHGQRKEVRQFLVDVADGGERREGVAHTAAQLAVVGPLGEEHGVGLLPVAARAPRLLEVGLGRFGGFDVYHKAHVGLVDAHAKGVGGHHHSRLALVPALLAELLVDAGEACVVVERGDAGGLEEAGVLARGLAIACVDDGGARHTAQDMHQFAALVLGVAHDVGQVAPLETHAYHIGLAELEAALYVLHDLGRGRGREGEHGGSRSPIARCSEPRRP